MRYKVDGIEFRYCRLCDSWVQVKDHNLSATYDELVEINRQRDAEDNYEQ